jgi:hypothetical protein
MMNDIEQVSADVIEQEIENLMPEDRERIRKAAQLWRAQMLCLWKVCPKAACRKAHACSANPDFCIGRFEFLVDEKVRTAVETLMYAKLHGYGFDDACAMTPPGSIEAYDVWLATLFRQQESASDPRACETD